MNFLLLITLAGFGTYLMRLVPLVSGHKMNQWHPVVTLALSALGLSAIATLIVLSVAGLWQASPNAHRAVAMAGGALAVLVSLRVFRNVGMATLIGALSYGLLDAGLEGGL
ncbi:MAG: AzlD domain-containing protein [Saccharospirillum sp.]